MQALPPSRPQPRAGHYARVVREGDGLARVIGYRSHVQQDDWLAHSSVPIVSDAQPTDIIFIKPSSSPRAN